MQYNDRRMHDSPATRNIRILVEYDGSGYAGWQLQKGLPTIQGAILDALEEFCHERPVIRVAGRTDAGVHAVGQVASFVTGSELPAERFAPALNAHLPNDIAIHESIEVPMSFDARMDSKSKRYRYRVYSARQPASLELNRAWQIRRKLDTRAMREAAGLLLGHHDFNAFRSAHCDADHATRHMYSIDVERQRRAPRGEIVEIRFHANAYCRHMCRIIAGTLVEVGRGSRTIESVETALKSRDRASAGVTAPPFGLTLEEVFY